MNKLQADQLKILIAADQGQLNVLVDGNKHPEFYKWMALAHGLIKEEAVHELLPAIRTYVANPTTECLEEVVDGAIDTVVVVMHLMNTLGIDFQSIWDEVQRANEAKIQADGKVHKQSNGKWLKPEGWTPPNVMAAIKPLQLSTEVSKQ